MRRLFFCFAVCFPFVFKAATIHQPLYLNRGVFTTVDQTTFPFLAFNATASFNALNQVISAVAGDTVVFHVHNNDSIPHAFAVKNMSGIGDVMAPGDSLTDTLSSAGENLFIYYDSLNYPAFRYLGAAGMICFRSPSVTKNFYWNLKEHEISYNQQLATGGNVNWSTYNPDYFTMNSLSHPDVLTDSLSHISAHVGDTIHLYIVNTGQSLHSLHFHGFHCRVVYSSNPRIGANWMKATVPVESMEVMILEIVPDKPGQYSVHDHNLVAASGGQTYPTGMLTVMDIQP